MRASLRFLKFGGNGKRALLGVFLRRASSRSSISTGSSARLPSLMRALEQRFLFDGAALIDGLEILSTIDSQSNRVAEAKNYAPVDRSVNTLETGKEDSNNCLPSTGKPMFVLQGEIPAAKLAEAIKQASDLLEKLPDRVDFQSIMSQVFGGSEIDVSAREVALTNLGLELKSGLQIKVELLPSLSGMGAYSSQGLDGQEVIYLNAQWLSSKASVTELVAVLLEEAGHSIDHRLNGDIDSRGDEGELFAYLIVNGAPSHDFLDTVLAENDHGKIWLEGRLIDVEFAANASPTIANTNPIISYVENAAAVAINPSLTISDDGTTLASAT